jgi:hypothetical protein
MLEESVGLAEEGQQRRQQHVRVFRLKHVDIAEHTPSNSATATLRW